jgi:predicted dienelactone hydrolase
MSGQPMVRALFRSVPMGGQPALSCKVYYPALYGATAAENNTGVIPAVRPERPYPVCLFMPGINVSPESYGWLATALAQSGIVTVLYSWILEEMPGLTSLTPGLDISALKPDVYGQRPSATALQALLADLGALNAGGPLAGLLDTQRVLLGGHSAGGSVALMNARPDWFPGLRGVFAYGSHSKASTMLGYPADTLLPLPDALPLLVLGGSRVSAG